MGAISKQHRTIITFAGPNGVVSVRPIRHLVTATTFEVSTNQTASKTRSNSNAYPPTLSGREQVSVAIPQLEYLPTKWEVSHRWQKKILKRRFYLKWSKNKWQGGNCESNFFFLYIYIYSSARLNPLQASVRVGHVNSQYLLPLKTSHVVTTEINSFQCYELP